MSHRLLAGFSLIFALSGVLAGCGAGGRSSSSTAAAGARPPSRALRSSARRPTRAQALAYARAVVLEKTDIAGASVSHEQRTSRGAAREFDRCERLASHPRKLADVSSPTFTRGEELEKEEIGSGVSVLASPRTAARTIRLIGSRAVRDCLHRGLVKSFARAKLHGAQVGPIAVTNLRVKAPGAAATVGVRMSAAITVPFSEVTVPIYADLLGFAVGRAEVGMYAISATQPVPGATERQLISLMLSRAESHVL